jgi:FO synthase
MEETISRMAGSENGSLKTIEELEAIAAAIGRPARQRTTEYGIPSAERIATARSDEGRARLTLSITPA